MLPDLLDDYPLLKQFVDAVHQLPAIKAWLEKRPLTGLWHTMRDSCVIWSILICFLQWKIVLGSKLRKREGRKPELTGWMAGTHLPEKHGVPLRQCGSRLVVAFVLIYLYMWILTNACFGRVFDAFELILNLRQSCACEWVACVRSQPFSHEQTICPMTMNTSLTFQRAEYFLNRATLHCILEIFQTASERSSMKFDCCQSRFVWIKVIWFA